MRIIILYNALYNKSAQDQKGESHFLQNQCIFIYFFLVFRLIFFLKTSKTFVVASLLL